MGEIGRLWMESNKRPTESTMNSKGRFSVQPYKKRWQSLRRAVENYELQYGRPTSVASDSSDIIASTAAASTECLIAPKTTKLNARSQERRPVYGEPIDFRGLRYAPVNEQGVVYLFGMVSHDLGFLIESVRTSFPDCEGKRAIDKRRTQWQRVLIEFEYRSKNFYEHGHDPKECDLIVCWVHNYEECPLEVLELKSALALLSNS